MSKPRKQTLQKATAGGRWLNRAVSVICLLSCLSAALLIHHHITYKNAIYTSKKSELKRLTINAAKQIAAILQQQKRSAEKLADGLTHRTVNKRNILAKIRGVLASNPNYYGCGIAYAPYAHDSKTKLYAPYYSKSGPRGEMKFLQIGKVYDYTTSKYDWYTTPMAEGNRWSEPYWDEAGKTYMITYSALFYRTDPTTHLESPVGVAGIDISVNRIKKIIESLNIGPSGFGALTTRNGNYLYHPNYEYVQSHMNIRDVARKKHDEDRLRMAKLAAQGKGGIIDHIDAATGEESWLVFEPVPLSGWSLQNTFIMSDLDVDVATLRHQVIWILIAGIIFIASAAFLALRVNLGSSVRVWLFTATVSLLFIGGICEMWHLALAYHSSPQTHGVKIADKATLRAQMSRYRITSEKKYLPEPIFIPTGLYIDTLDLKGANNLLVTGRIWQRYPANYPKNQPRGVQFGRAESIKMKQTDVEHVDGGEVIRWSFQANLRVRLDYSRYPLEAETLGIEILPMDIDGNLVLVPDLSSYKLTTPKLLPELDHKVFMPGWRLTQSYFLMHAVDGNSDFGIQRNFDQEVLPTLYLMIGAKRTFIDAFISNLTPLIIVSIILFALSLLAAKIEIGKALGVCVSVFFVVVFSHLSIRRSIAAGEIFYLEYIYFVIYFTIILVPMNTFRLTLGMRSRFFEYRNGLLANAIYWPSVLGSFFTITVVKFY